MLRLLFTNGFINISKIYSLPLKLFHKRKTNKKTITNLKIPLLYIILILFTHKIHILKSIPLDRKYHISTNI
jgi:hypothetical protein